MYLCPESWQTGRNGDQHLDQDLRPEGASESLKQTELLLHRNIKCITGPCDNTHNCAPTWSAGGGGKRSGSRLAARGSGGRGGGGSGARWRREARGDVRGEWRTGWSPLVALSTAGARSPRTHHRLCASGQIIDGAGEVLKDSTEQQMIKHLLDIFHTCYLFASTQVTSKDRKRPSALN